MVPAVGCGVSTLAGSTVNTTISAFLHCKSCGRVAIRSTQGRLWVVIQHTVFLCVIRYPFLGCTSTLFAGGRSSHNLNSQITDELPAILVRIRDVLSEGRRLRVGNESDGTQSGMAAGRIVTESPAQVRRFVRDSSIDDKSFFDWPAVFIKPYLRVAHICWTLFFVLGLRPN